MVWLNVNQYHSCIYTIGSATVASIPILNITSDVEREIKPIDTICVTK